MNGRMWLIVIGMGALNVLAIGFWLFASRFSVVMRGPLRPATVEAGRRTASWVAAGSRRVAASWASIDTSLRRSWSAIRTRAVPAGSATRSPELDTWIEDVEREESAPPAAAAAVQPTGSEDWWRAWAESGGNLPPAAASCRPNGGRPAQRKVVS